MGTSSSSPDEEDSSWCSAPAAAILLEPGKKARILCLHGWRTNAEILSFQMGAMQANINTATFVFLDAPYPARGDPVPGIAMFYPDRPYYEWFYRTADGNGYEGLEESVQRLVEYMEKDGPFDGLLGFSQGASMVTRLLKRQEDQKKSGPRFAILLGGVPPMEIIPQNIAALMVPSLHIMGEVDPFLLENKKVEALYGLTNRTTWIHNEGHNIPSIRTNLYPQMERWIGTQMMTTNNPNHSK